MSRIDVQQNSEDGVIHECNRQLCVGHVVGSLPINMKKQSQTVSVFFFSSLEVVQFLSCFPTRNTKEPSTVFYNF